MDSAKKILLRYGWKDGDGLGKNNQGISKPLKPSMKFDNAGLGYKVAAEFEDDCWQKMFDEAAKNLKTKDLSTKTKTDNMKRRTTSLSESSDESNQDRKAKRKQKFTTCRGEVKKASGKLARIEAQDLEFYSKLKS